MSFKVNSQLLPPGFPREFDAHIYYTEESQNEALHLHQQVQKQFAGKTVFTGEMIPVPIGPHPMPMFEVNFPLEHFSEVVLWLMHARGSLNILVHELGGNDLQDHTQGAIWLGTPVPLIYSAFKNS